MSKSETQKTVAEYKIEYKKTKEMYTEEFYWLGFGKRLRLKTKI